MRLSKLLLLIIVLISIINTKASAYDAKIDGIYYLFYSDNTAMVTYEKSESVFDNGHSGSRHMEYYSDYTGDVVIPEYVTYNGTTYTVTRISTWAFSRSINLTSLTIPQSVSIGESAFYRTNINNIKIKVTDYAAFCKNTLLKSIEYQIPIILLDEINNEIKEFTIPENVTYIESKAFKNCSGLTSINIPNSVTYISLSAFAGCTSLTSLTIPSSVTSIGDYAFSDCSGLESIIMQNSLQYTNKNIFNKCDNIREVTFDCEYIHSIFSDCLSLEKVIITDKAIAIGTQAFQNCSGLKTIDISNSVTSIGRNAFRYCSSLTSVTLPNSVTSIGDYAFEGCTGLKFVNCLCDPTSIGDDVFSRCSNIKEVTFDCEFVKSLFCNISSINKINLTDKVTSIGDRAFYGCSGLTSINIPNSVTSIGNSSFSGCSSLTSVTIPNSVTSFGEKAFSQSNILVIISLISEPFPIYFTFSSNTFKNAILYVPKGTMKKYKSTNGWSSFANIKEFDGETGIKSITSDSEVYEVYTLDGNRTQHPSKGIHIIKMKDGTVKKGFVK